MAAAIVDLGVRLPGDNTQGANGSRVEPMPSVVPQTRMAGATGSRKLYPVTSLRFFAAALVVTLHARGHFGIDPAFAEPFMVGHVSFFFVLSGFILVHVYPTAGSSGARQFWLARMARIWPSHVAALLLLLLLVPTARPTADGAWLGGLWSNLMLVQVWNPFAQANDS